MTDAMGVALFAEFSGIHLELHNDGYRGRIQWYPSLCSSRTLQSTNCTELYSTNVLMRQCELHATAKLCSMNRYFSH